MTCQSQFSLCLDTSYHVSRQICARRHSYCRGLREEGLVMAGENAPTAVEYHCCNHLSQWDARCFDAV